MAPGIFIFSIVLCAEYSSYVKSVAACAPTFFGYIISILASDEVEYLYIHAIGNRNEDTKLRSEFEEWLQTIKQTNSKFICIFDSNSNQNYIFLCQKKVFISHTIIFFKNYSWRKVNEQELSSEILQIMFEKCFEKIQITCNKIVERASN